MWVRESSSVSGSVSVSSDVDSSDSSNKWQE